MKRCELEGLTEPATPQEAEGPLTAIMDRIDDCKRRGAINDLSALAYSLVVKQAALLEACRHAAKSCHHPHCQWRKTRCTCHVEKARAAIANASSRDGV
jgi:hypothetical protein